MTQEIQRKPPSEREHSDTTTTEKPENVADYAKNYETGDTIIVQHSNRDELLEREIIGWSTIYEPSAPVIRAPHDEWDGPLYVDECVVDAESYAGPFEWGENDD